MGKNPMMSAGCWAICSALLKNPNVSLKLLDFTDIKVDADFHEVYSQVKLGTPELGVLHEGEYNDPVLEGYQFRSGHGSVVRIQYLRAVDRGFESQKSPWW